MGLIKAIRKNNGKTFKAKKTPHSLFIKTSFGWHKVKHEDVKEYELITKKSNRD